MIKAAGRTFGLTGVARTAERLIAGREAVRDQPAIEHRTASGVTEQLNPMCATPTVNVVYGQAFRRTAAHAGPAVVIKHLLADLLPSATLRFAPLLRVRLLPPTLLLTGLLRVRLVPQGRPFLDPLRIRLVVATASFAPLLRVRLCPAALALSFRHAEILREAEFDDVVQRVRKRMREIAVLDFEGRQIAALREYWSSERVADLVEDGDV